jgi:hypothetical protein
MADAFLSLSAGNRRDALAVASAASGRPTHLLEKDVWVVWALETLFGAKFGAQLQVINPARALAQQIARPARANPCMPFGIGRQHMPCLIEDIQMIAGKRPPVQMPSYSPSREIRTATR